MQYSKPCQVLVDEHDVIISVVEAVEAMLGKADDHGFDREFFERVCDFFATFADACHHSKEEVYLFPMLEKRGITRQYGPIGCMLHDHDEGRSYIRAARDALRSIEEGDQSACEVVKLSLNRFCELLRRHIQKENRVLFVVGDQAMSDADKDLLAQEFNSAQHGTLPPGTHDKYTLLAGELRKVVGLGPASPGLSRNQGEGGFSCHHT